MQKYHKNEMPKKNIKGDLRTVSFDCRMTLKEASANYARCTYQNYKHLLKSIRLLCEPITVKKASKDPYRTAKTFIKAR